MSLGWGSRNAYTSGTSIGRLLVLRSFWLLRSLGVDKRGFVGTVGVQ